MPANDNVEEFDVKDDETDVENPEEEDETEDEADTETQDDDDTDDDSKDEPKEAKFDKKYTQLKGETLAEYKSSLEEAYNKSSAQGVTLNRENTELKKQLAGFVALAEKNPEIAKQLGLADKTETPSQSTAESYAEQLMNEKMETEYAAFAKDHSEIDTDEVIRQEVLAEVGVQADAYKARTGKVISMTNALNRAWKVLGYDDNSKEDLAVKTKEQAGQGRAGASSKKSTSTKTTDISDKAMQMAKKMGLSEKDIQKYYKN